MSALNSRQRGIRQRAFRLRREVLRMLSRQGRRTLSTSTAAGQGTSTSDVPSSTSAGRGAVR